VVLNPSNQSPAPHPLGDVDEVSGDPLNFDELLKPSNFPGHVRRGDALELFTGYDFLQKEYVTVLDDSERQEVSCDVHANQDYAGVSAPHQTAACKAHYSHPYTADGKL